MKCHSARNIGLWHLLVMLAGCLYLCETAWAVQVEDLDSSKEWRIEKIEITGNEKFSGDALAGEILTTTRPWYRFWQDPPVFDPVTFKEDLERLRRFYEARGYYGTEVSHDLVVDAEQSRVTAKIELREGAPVIVSAVDVEIAGSALKPEKLPIKSGDVFTEITYQNAEQTLRQFYANQGYAYVTTERHAEVNLERDQVHITYRVNTGPLSVFGATRIEGTEKVDPEIILRELTYQPSETFSATKIIESQDRILALDLFSVVRIAPQQLPNKPAVVPMEVQVKEKEPREINLGIGYGTEEQFRARVEWRDNNFFGDGRRLSIMGKYSLIELTGEINFIQPHFLSPRNRAIVNFRQYRQDEQTFLLTASRFNPRIERAFSKQLTGFIAYRVEYDRLDHVDASTIRALGGIEDHGLLSGPSLGLVYNTSNEPFNPTQGEIVTFTLEQAGKIWGGRYNFIKGTLEGKKYLSLGWETVFATRLKLGLADPLGSEKFFPLFERFFSGGDKSVRGFGRRRLGPLSASNDPLGGLSLMEGSLELRRPIWGALGGDVFLDFGQVSTHTFDIPIDHLRFAAGFGFSYQTPVGPLRFDIGFPFRKPPNDRPWQIHFSVGAPF
jgi:outer membrane protein assembly complex protein YaeT